MQCEEVWPYYEYLNKHRLSLLLKRILDVVFSILLLILLILPCLIIAIVVACESKGGLFYTQKRVTQYGRIFNIHKFRTMRNESDNKGSLTVFEDERITKSGRWMRKYHIDEIPQLIDILAGNMTFVGTRPEVPEFVSRYTNEMNATLLLPAGITSSASIAYRNEYELLISRQDAEKIYIEEILPKKMVMNLMDLKKFNLLNDFFLMLRTIKAVL